MELSEEDVQKILKVLDQLDYSEIRLEVGELKLHVQKTAREAPSTSMPEESPAKPSAARPERAAAPRNHRRAAPQESATLRLVKSPTAGVFYRAPGPGQPPFVELGKSVEAQDTVCLVEVMKLFQSVPAGCRGRISEFLVDNGEAVKQGQALMVIETET